MASLRQIRRRIRSTQSTKQIMRAMQLVSGSKFKRAQARLFQTREILAFLDALLQRVLAGAPGLKHPLAAQPAEAKPDVLVIITSDAGLAGAYNNNLIQLAEAELRKDTARVTQLVFIGKRGFRYFTKRGYKAADSVLDMAGRPDLAKINAIGKKLLDRFLTGEISGVKLLYAKFISPSVLRPAIRQWLPISMSNKQQAVSSKQELKKNQKGYIEYPAKYIFEPSAEAVFKTLLPQWTLATFQLVMLEAFTSEHGARMIAMKNATDNAQEILTSLTLTRNKIRQATITKELSEIVGTAEALK